MFLFVWTNSWMHVSELVISIMFVLILGGWYRAGGGSKIVLIEKWANLMCQEVKIDLFTRPQVHKHGDRYV